MKFSTCFGQMLLLFHLNQHSFIFTQRQEKDVLFAAAVNIKCVRLLLLNFVLYLMCKSDVMCGAVPFKSP